jgi:hypothetical protein
VKRYLLVRETHPSIDVLSEKITGGWISPEIALIGLLTGFYTFNHSIKQILSFFLLSFITRLDKYRHTPLSKCSLFRHIRVGVLNMRSPQVAVVTSLYRRYLASNRAESMNLWLTYPIPSSLNTSIEGCLCSPVTIPLVKKTRYIHFVIGSSVINKQIVLTRDSGR